jgi:hypothetical protein
MARRLQGLLPPALTRRLTKEEAKRLGVSHAAKLYVDAALSGRPAITPSSDWPAT